MLSAHSFVKKYPTLPTIDHNCTYVYDMCLLRAHVRVSRTLWENLPVIAMQIKPAGRLREDFVSYMFERKTNTRRANIRQIVAIGTLLAIALCGCKRKPEPSNSRPRNLLEAAKIGDRAAAEEFLAQGMPVNDRGTLGLTPLHLAAWYGHTDVVELLLRNGAQVDAKDKRGMTPLYWAAAEGNKQTVQLLIAEGANANAKDNDGKTALDRAIILSKTKFRRGSAFAKRKKAFEACIRIL